MGEGNLPPSRLAASSVVSVDAEIQGHVPITGNNFIPIFN